MACSTTLLDASSPPPGCPLWVCFTLELRAPFSFSTPLAALIDSGCSQVPLLSKDSYLQHQSNRIFCIICE